MRTAIKTKPALAALLVLAAAVPARADDAVIKSVYASMEIVVHNEYARALDVMGPRVVGPSAKAEETRQALKTLFYNRAALFATCFDQAQKERAADAPPIPAERNIFLTTCVDSKFNELDDFSRLLAYAHAFFPDRVTRCGEATRLREREKLLPPYDFLALKDAKLYDFTRYNKCLMTMP